MEHKIGYPKYAKGENVGFIFDKGAGSIKECQGSIYLIDAYGTFEQNEEASYDIISMNEGEKCLYKHVRESSVHPIETK